MGAKPKSKRWHGLCRLRVKVVLPAILLAVGAAGGMAVAQNTSRDKFVARSELVLIPVIARDEQGRPVPGLSKDDFLIFDNGRPQEIYTVDAPPVSRPAPERPAPATAGIWLNSEQATPQHLTIIALDAPNTAGDDMKFVVERLGRFLARGLAESNPVALVLFEKGGVRIVHHFSANAAVVRSALDSIRMPADMLNTPALDASTLSAGGDMAAGRSKAVLDNMQLGAQRQVEDSLADLTADSMFEAAKMFASFTGQKTLIWIGGGFKYRQFRPTQMGQNTSLSAASGINTEHWERAFRALNAAGISVFAVDARGLASIELGKREVVTEESMGKTESPTQKLASAIANANSERNLISDGYHWVAQKTGGTVFANANDIDRGIDQAYALSGTAYLVAFRPAKAKPGWHNVEVKINRPGVRVLARRGYDNGLRARLERKDSAGALVSPFAEADFPLAVEWQRAPMQLESGSIASFTVMAPPGALAANPAGKLSLEILLVAFTSEEKQVSAFRRPVELQLDDEARRKLAENGFRYSGQIEIPAGTSRIHAIVREKQDGRVASVWIDNR